MSSEWQVIRLEEVTSILGDGLHGTPEYNDDGDYFFINGNNLRNGKIVFNENTRRTSIVEFNKYKKELNDRTILVSINGTLGNVALYKGEKVVLGKSACYFNVLESVDKQFVRYVLTSKLFQNYINTLATGSTIQNVSLKLMRNFAFPLPPFELQQNISGVLACLDDRITLLRETNTTLEAIAQALFKSWFVDFDPVRAKQEGREPEGMDADTAALFPNSFEESELGLVPNGWRVTNCQNIIDVRDGTHESPKPSQEGLPLITSRHITGGRINFDDTYLISEQDYENISKRSKVHRLDVLITMIGTVGLTVIVMEETVEFAIKNIGLFKTSAVPHMCHYFYLLLSSSRMQQYLEARLAGTTQKYLSLKALREIAVLVPSESVLTEFSKIISPVFERVHQNNSKAQTLATLRDTLLPRLISGQLRLPDAEALVDEVGFVGAH